MKSNVEIWKPVAETGFEELYEVSNFGQIRSKNFRSNHKKPIMLKQTLSKDGYYVVKLSNKPFVKTIAVHRIVAKTFLENPNNFPEINHKDENKLNNHAENLEFCTRLYNNRYGTRTKRSSLSRQKPVIQMNIIGEVIKKWDCISQPAEIYNTHHIGECCLGKRKTVKGFVWRYDNEV